MGAHRRFALTDRALRDACGTVIAFTSRAGGVSASPYATLNIGGHVGDDEEAVMQNRRIVLEALGAPEAALIVPNQAHGTRLVRMTSSSTFEAVVCQAQEGADAVAVDVCDVAALLNSADCLLLIVVAPSGRFVIAHAGWRGAVAHIAADAVKSLAENGEDPAGFNAYLGPHIGPECFEVGPEVLSAFDAQFGSSAIADESHVDLARAVRVDLMRSGMRDERILDCGICTKCNSDEYFSYRASNGVCGRHAAVAVRLAH